MSLFIEIENGVPVGHPITAENLIQVYGTLDFSALPETFVPFERTDPRVVDPYAVVVNSEYVFENGVVKERLLTRLMTDEERSAFIAETRFYLEQDIKRARARAIKRMAEVPPELAIVLQAYIDRLDAFDTTDPVGLSVPEYPDYADREAAQPL